MEHPLAVVVEYAADYINEGTGTYVRTMVATFAEQANPPEHVAVTPLCHDSLHDLTQTANEPFGCHDRKLRFGDRVPSQFYMTTLQLDPSTDNLPWRRS